ncbi:MAG: hypothetical protein MI867_23520 [Pseudomonadales bacterium]|nr:hypothetical protein [Pseudomonadales bacterium]
MLTAVAGIAGVIFLCWLVFTLAVNALPFFVGLSVAMLAFNGGAGTAVAAALGVAATALTLIAGRAFFAVSTSRAIRVPVAALFAVPAAIAGYHVAYGLVGISEAAEVWRQAVGVVCAFVTAAASWWRMIDSTKTI